MKVHLKFLTNKIAYSQVFVDIRVLIHVRDLNWENLRDFHVLVDLPIVCRVDYRTENEYYLA